MTLSCQQSQNFSTIYSMLWLSLHQLFWDEGEIVSKTCRLLKMGYVNVHILRMPYHVQEDNKEMPIITFQIFCWICQQKQLIFPRRVLCLKVWLQISQQKAHNSLWPSMSWVMLGQIFLIVNSQRIVALCKLCLITSTGIKRSQTCFKTCNHSHANQNHEKTKNPC